MQPHLKIVHDTRRKKKDDSYPLKLRITFNRQQEYFPLGIDLTLPEWERLNGDRLSKEIKLIKNNIVEIEAKAINIIKEIKPFSFSSFETKFYSVRKEESNIDSLYEDYIAKLKKDSRISTAVSYNASYTSLKKFKKKLNIDQISIDFLKEYEKWMLEQGNSATTIGIYLRPLRTLFNIAIEKNIVTREQYPFGKRKYMIPSGRNIKKALSKGELNKILTYEPIQGTTEDKAKDLWLFTYLCNGINMKDIAQLKYSNIHGDYIQFTRAKTKETIRGNSRPISFYLNEKVKAIIKKWGNSNKISDNYIFPILDINMNAERQYAAIQQFIKTVNKYMNRIAREVGVNKNVTTYTARHTFATILKQANASTEIIQELLGHTDKKTTENYLGSFEDNVLKDISNTLLNLNNSR